MAITVLGRFGGQCSVGPRQCVRTDCYEGASGFHAMIYIWPMSILLTVPLFFYLSTIETSIITDPVQNYATTYIHCPWIVSSYRDIMSGCSKTFYFRYGSTLMICGQKFNFVDNISVVASDQNCNLGASISPGTQR